MILFLYNVALLAGLVISAPWWLLRMATTQKYREGLLARLGWMPSGLRETLKKVGTERQVIWIHAVSVGEVLAVSRMVHELDAALPDYCVVLSTTTRTGQALARERFGMGRDFLTRVFYCPLDLPWATRAYLNALKPRLFVLAETEFWPNLLSGCYRRKIPVAVVNARISDRSWPRYRRLRGLWRGLLKPLACVLAQSELDAERLMAIGCKRESVSVAGNLKFDVRVAEEAEATRMLKNLTAGLRVVVAGSTLEGEEAALLGAWPELLVADAQLAMVIAPRHPERFDVVAALLERSGVRWNRRSALASAEAILPGEIVLLDTIGELASVYSLAAVAFVGGSLIPAGGHNPLEPAQFGVPVVMGPHTANFRTITDELLAKDAVRIADRDKLANALNQLLLDTASATAMGMRSKKVFDQQAGATDRCVQALEALLSLHDGSEITS